MQLIFKVNMLLAFLLELLLFIGVGILGYHAVGQGPLKYVLAIGLPVAAVVLWALWAAPRSRRRLPQPYLSFFKLVLFGDFGVCVYLVGHQAMAEVFIPLAIVNVLLEYVESKGASARATKAH